MGAPCVERGAFLAGEIVFLVNPDDSAKAPAGMVQDFLDRLNPHAKPGHAGRGAKPKLAFQRAARTRRRVLGGT
jgi:hypothetical protein